MYIQKIHIENFRLLKNVDIVLDKSLTLIVGKNNTGKTSVAHLIQSIINENFNYPFEISPPSERCCWVLLKPRKPLKIRQFIHAKAL